MANVQPFQPYRYSSEAGPLARLVTQPYDKITPEMRTRYLELSPYNLVRVILGEPHAGDTEENNVYTRAAHDLNNWIFGGVLVREPEPALFAYFQEFTPPDSSETLLRKGFIGLGALQPYSAGIVHRHEQTLSGPKKDRAELLRRTRAHFGQIFMLYPDPARLVDTELDKAAQGTPDAEVTDEYGTAHRLWRIADPEQVLRIQRLMLGKKLIIADGHHRYETALAAGDEYVMMTFVNMHSPGLKILATHRTVTGLEMPVDVVFPNTRELASLDELKQVFARPAPEKIRIGIALPGGIRLMERARQPGELDVPVLHQELLQGVLGIGEEAVRDEKYLRYVRGLDAAHAKVQTGEAQVAFLLEPATVEQVAEVAFGGGVMPQKSTDFYPKLLSGLTIYKVDQEKG